jgi:hypothetical protein
VTARDPIGVRGSKTLFARRGHRHGGNLGSDLLGKEDVMPSVLGAEMRPVGRDQNILDKVVLLLPPCPASMEAAVDVASAIGYPLKGEG